MRPRNMHIEGTEEELLRLAQEYQMIGRDVSIKNGILTVYALPRRSKKNSDKKVDKRKSSR